jgi:hypothetical protein
MALFQLGKSHSDHHRNAEPNTLLIRNEVKSQIRINIKVNSPELWRLAKEPWRLKRRAIEAHPGSVETHPGDVETLPGAVEGCMLLLQINITLMRIRYGSL